MKKYIPVLTVLLTMTACGKEALNIGKENPASEIEKCTYFAEKKVYDKAVECLEIYKSRFSGSKWGMEAELRIADTYFRQKEYLLAAGSYQSFVRLYPTHPKIDYAYFQTGMAFWNEAPKSIDRDQKYLYKSIEMFEFVLHTFPGSTYMRASENALANAKHRLAERLYYIGKFYFRTGEYLAAIPRLTELSETYPQFEETPRALYLLTRANLGVRQNEKARQAVEKLVLAFPKNRWTRKAQERYLEALTKQEPK